MKKPTEEWILKTDDALSKNGVPVKRRPMDAWAQWQVETGPTGMGSPEAKAIFDWYEAKYPPGTFDMGSLFTGAFFFDQAVWPVHVPIGFGTCRITVDKMLAGMTALIGERLTKDAQALDTLNTIAVDCIDYSYGVDDCRGAGRASRSAVDLLLSGDKELRAAVEVLLSKRPSQKAAESAALATEMFFKSFLTQHAALDDAGARSISHNVGEGLKQCLAHSPQSDLRMLTGRIGALPKIGQRYVPLDVPLKDLWQAYSLAQFAGAVVVRSFTGRACRPV